MKNKIQRFEEFNESVVAGLLGIGAIAAAVAGFGPGAAEKSGAALSKIEKGISKIGKTFGKTGNDEDLAKQITNYLKNVPTDYIANDDFNKERVYNPKPGNYFFYALGNLKTTISRLFKGDPNTEYRVDVTHDTLEDTYKVYIASGKEAEKSKSTTGGFNPFETRSKSNTRQPVASGPPKMSYSEIRQLDCSEQEARMIYEKCEFIFKKTAPNAAGQARGNLNTTEPQQGRLGKFFKKWTKYTKKP
jgi:hypothetical protein